MTDYITENEFRSYIQDATTAQPDVIAAVITAASRAVDSYCGRRFFLDSSATARVYWPRGWYDVDTDDIGDTTSIVLKTAPGYDGTYSQTWTTADYITLPRNGLSDSMPWATTGLRATGLSLWFPPLRNMFGLPYIETVQVTAKWGWATVPEPVKQATKILAALYYKLGEAPFGTAGFGEYGMIRVRDNPIASELLRPYSRQPIAVG